MTQQKTQPKSSSTSRREKTTESRKSRRVAQTPETSPETPSLRQHALTIGDLGESDLRAWSNELKESDPVAYAKFKNWE